MDQAAETMIANLKEKTGKSLEDWILVVRDSGIAKHGEIIKFLKQEHNFTHGFANLVAHKSKGSDAGSAENTDDLITAQYQGKEGLKPIYDQLINAIQKFGGDVEVAPKKAYVSVRRKKQFALIQPSTKSRLDIGINLKGEEAQGRLENSGSFNAMCSHRVRTAELSDVDPELIGWLKEAYERAG